MILASAALVVVAVALLVVGIGDELTDEGLGFLYGSMACSLLAVLVLLFGVLQRRATARDAAPTVDATDA